MGVFVKPLALEYEGRLLADNSYRHSLGMTDRCCPVSGYSPGVIFSDTYSSSRPEAELAILACSRIYLFMSPS